jgi:hypothetical protein
MGSIAYTATARAGYVAVRAPDDPTLRHLACVKSNLAPTPATLDYRIMTDGLGVPFIEWLGASPLSAFEVLASDANDDLPGKQDEAMNFVREELSGGSVESKQVIAHARLKGIAYITLRRAQEKLGVRVEKVTDPQTGKVISWIWRFPK